MSIAERMTPMEAIKTCAGYLPYALEKLTDDEEKAHVEEAAAILSKLGPAVHTTVAYWSRTHYFDIRNELARLRAACEEVERDLANVWDLRWLADKLKKAREGTA